jgi:hypothetical protein
MLPMSPRQKLKPPPSSPKPHLALWSPFEAMTAQAKNARRQHLQAVAAMASLVASLATSLALAVMANQAAMADVTVVAKALRRAVHVWVMLLSAPNASLWNRPKMRCVVWPHKPMVRC